MLALIAGRGGLPEAMVEALPERPLICAMEGSLPDRLQPDRLFRIERLGNLLGWLKRRGITRICMAGAVTRPQLRLSRISPATLRYVPAILRALKRGDDGALRAVIAVIETAGFEVLGAHEAAPDLLPPAGIPTSAQPGAAHRQDAMLGDRVSADQGARDLGQSCVLGEGRVIAREGEAGTDAMLRALPPEARGAIFYKAPKPGQDRRADLPVIGPDTAEACIAAGLSGLVVEAGGVIVLDRARVVDRLDVAGLFLWIRERPI